MIYAFVTDTYSTKPELFVAKDSDELLTKLKARFKKFNINEFKATNLQELEDELEALGRGYHGSADLNFSIETAH